LWRRDSAARINTSRAFLNSQIGSISERSFCFGKSRREKKQEEKVETNFGDKRFWDSEYCKFEVATYKKTFDWYQNYNKCIPLKERIRQDIPKTHKILNIGCGNSLMSEHMLEDGYTDLTNIDFSAAAIRIMNKRTKLEPKWDKVIYLEMDAAKLDFPDESFDAVIDKGTIDSQLCEKLTAKETIDAVVAETYRVLKPGGVFFIISFYKGFERMFLSKKGYSWQVYQRMITDYPHYTYTVRKRNSMQERPKESVGDSTKSAVDGELKSDVGELKNKTSAVDGELKREG